MCTRSMGYLRFCCRKMTGAEIAEANSFTTHHFNHLLPHNFLNDRRGLSRWFPRLARDEHHLSDHVSRQIVPFLSLVLLDSRINLLEVFHFLYCIRLDSTSDRVKNSLPEPMQRILVQGMRVSRIGKGLDRGIHLQTLQS